MSIRRKVTVTWEVETSVGLIEYDTELEAVKAALNLWYTVSAVDFLEQKGVKGLIERYYELRRRQK